MNKLQKRKVYDQHVLRVMVEIYCRNKHLSNGLCHECLALLNYANGKVEKCPLKESKTTCRNCTTHCYATLQRDKIKQVMRYSGPRMILHHPVMAIRHLLRELF